MKLIIAIALVTLSLNIYGDEATLCSDKDKVLFGCEVNKKYVSVCLSYDEENSPILNYRYGAKEKIDLSIAGSHGINPSAPRLGRIPYARGQTIYARFPHKDYDYIVYSNQGYGYKDVADPNSIEQWLYEGVLVVRGNDVIANFPCNSNRTESDFQYIDPSALGFSSEMMDTEGVSVENLLDSVDLEVPFKKQK